MSWRHLSSFVRDLRDTSRRLGIKAPVYDLRTAALDVAVGRHGAELVRGLPVVMNLAALAITLDPLLVHEIRGDVPELVDATDLHALPGEAPRLLRRPFLLEVRHPDRGERLFGDTVGLGGYELGGAILIVGLTYPDGIVMARWTPTWSGEEIEASVAVDRSPLIDGVDAGTHQAWAIDAARFVTVFGLLLDAAGTPVRLVDDVEREKAPRGQSRKVKPPPAWITRYVSLSPSPWGASGGAVEASGEASAPTGKEATVRPVRGHLKRQRHGPGNAERRWMWIESYEARRWVAPCARRVVVSR